MFSRCFQELIKVEENQQIRQDQISVLEERLPGTGVE